MLYYSLIYPYFYYSNIVWALTYKTNLRHLVILQKRIIRIINKSHFNNHTDSIYKNLGILNRGGSRIFLGGGALVSYSTSTPINHIVLIGRIPVVLENSGSS